jgi:hypothetical protein
MQEPSQLATRGTCVPEAKTRSAGWSLIVAVASRVAEMNALLLVALRSIDCSTTLTWAESLRPSALAPSARLQQAYTTCIGGHIEWVVGARADSERFEVRRLSGDLFGYLQGRSLSHCPLNISSPPGHGVRDSARGDPHPKIIAIGHRRRKFCRESPQIVCFKHPHLTRAVPKQSRLFLIPCHMRWTSPTMLCVVLACCCTTELSFVRSAGAPKSMRPPGRGVEIEF